MKLLLVACCALTFASVALGATRTTGDPRYDTVASKFAMRPVQVLCYTEDEDGSPESVNAWGYVILDSNIENMSALVCRGLAQLVNGEYKSDYEMAAGALVLTHESYHLRLQLRNRADEAKTECRAIRHFRYAVYFLSHDLALARRLLPIALKIHNGLNPSYHDPTCRLPKP